MSLPLSWGFYAWYSAWNVVVSVSEVAFHLTRELSYTGCFEYCARCVELLADFIGVFDDIFDEPVHPALHPEQEIGYFEGESLAQHVRRGGIARLDLPIGLGSRTWRKLSGVL